MNIKSTSTTSLILLVTITITCFIAMTFASIGVAWDEPTYISRGDLYLDWIKHPSFTTINDHWYLGDIHPPLRKILGSVSYEFFSNTLHITHSAIIGYRLSTFFFVIPFIMLFMVFINRHWGITTSLFSILSLFLLPHFFYHSHLYTLDMAMVALWFFAIVIVTSTKIHHWVKLMLLSVIISSAVLTKFSGIFLFIPVGIWLCWEHTSHHWKTSFRFNIKPLIFVLFDGIFLSVMTILLFFAFWPYLWITPLLHFSEFIIKQLSHHFIPIYYLGQTYHQAPWHYPFVIFFVTTPVPILILFCISACIILIRGTALERFVLFNAIIPIAVVALPQSPKYDSIRLFLPAYPFVIATAFIGIRKIVSFIQPKIIQQTVLLGISLNCLFSTIYALSSVYPNTFTYYNSIVKGLPGAKNYGFEREYWGSSFLSLLPYLNANPEKKYCAYPVTDMFSLYKRDGLLSPNIDIQTDRTECQIFLLLEREGFLQDPEIAFIRSHMPIIKTVSLQDIPLITVYRLK